MTAVSNPVILSEALRSIRKIVDEKHPKATPGEKLTRIAWVLLALPPELRDMIASEAKRRVVQGWEAGLKPTEF